MNENVRQQPLTQVYVKPGYESLHSVLVAALQQAQSGKGVERHGLTGLPFEKQRMQTISELIGSPEGMAYQACKKVTEALNLPTTERQEVELLGAINYIAGMIIFIRNRDEKETTDS